MVRSITYALALTLWLAASASAQDAVEQHTETITDEAPPEDADETNLVLSAGGAFQTGNTDALLLNSGGLFELVRGMHSFELQFAYVLGLATGVTENEMGEEERADFLSDTVAHNINARARYDLFFTPNDAAFGAFLVRWDRFAALAPRLQGQIGYLRNFLKEIEGEGDDAKVVHRFWGEVGYDITGDFFDYDLVPPPDDPVEAMRRPENEAIHSARVLLGYRNRFTESFEVRASVEGLINLQRPEDSRINGTAAARASIDDALQLEVRLLVFADTEPPEGTRPVDTTTTINLVYTLL